MQTFGFSVNSNSFHPAGLVRGRSNHGLWSHGKKNRRPLSVMRLQPLLKSRVCGFVAAPGMTDNPERRQSRRYFISGMVQGVGYRYFALRAAERLGVTGYAKNLGDGRVEVYAVGKEQALAKFRTELERGPQGALVSNVSEEDAPLLDPFSKRFSIEH